MSSSVVSWAHSSQIRFAYPASSRFVFHSSRGWPSRAVYINRYYHLDRGRAHHARSSPYGRPRSSSYGSWTTTDGRPQSTSHGSPGAASYGWANGCKWHGSGDDGNAAAGTWNVPAPGTRRTNDVQSSPAPSDDEGRKPADSPLQHLADDHLQGTVHCYIAREPERSANDQVGVLDVRLHLGPFRYC